MIIESDISGNNRTKLQNSRNKVKGKETGT